MPLVFRVAQPKTTEGPGVPALSASDAKAVARAMNLPYCICQKIDDVYTDIVTEANQDEATGLKSALQQHFVDVQKYD